MKPHWPNRVDWAEAIARTDDIGVLTQALKNRERRRAHLQQELAAIEAREQLKSFDTAAVACELRRRVEEWRRLLHRNTPIARQVIDRLLADRIAWTPRRDEGVYEYAGRLHFDRLLAGIVATEHSPKQKRMRESIAVTEGMASPSRLGKVGGRLERVA